MHLTKIETITLISRKWPVVFLLVVGDRTQKDRNVSLISISILR